MTEPAGEGEVVWSREGDAWVGVPRGEHAASDGGMAGNDGYAVEVLLRAKDWQTEISHARSGGFKRNHVSAANSEEAKAQADDLLLAIRERTDALVEGAP